LVIGGGAAGIRAALAASGAGADVLLLTQGRPTFHGATFAGLGRGWGYQALPAAERTVRNLERFYDEIIQTGLGCAHPRLARILAEESGPCLQDLLAYGLILKTDAENRFLRVPGCFSSTPRAFLALDRQNIRTTFGRMLRRSGAATLNVSVLGLIMSDRCCRGAWGVTPTGEILLARAKAVILANGGGSGLFLTQAGPVGQTGSGYAWALAAGATMKNLEFIQFLLGFRQGRKLGLLPLNRLREPQAITDPAGQDLLRTALPNNRLRQRALSLRQAHAPFSSRDDSGLIDRAIAESFLRNEKVFYHDSSVPDPREVLHLAQAFNGGIRINTQAASTIPGLYAAGEIAAGPHGADRIGGCLLAATQVFGARAGRAAALYAKRIKALPRPVVPPELRRLRLSKNHSDREPVDEILMATRKKFSQEVMILRSESGLTECLAFLDRARNDIRTMKHLSSLKITSLQAIMVMEAVTRAALLRKNSLGSHYRTDDPKVHRRGAEIAEKK